MTDEPKNKLNKYYEVNDGFFTYYVNQYTGEKKFRLDDTDVLVEHNWDDFIRSH